MIKVLKFFFVSFIASMLFCWGVNAFAKRTEDFFFWHHIATNPQLLSAQVNQERLEKELKHLKPLRNREIEELELEARAALSLRIFENEQRGKVLFEKNVQTKLPIASLTKLMTALIVLENYEMPQEVSISREAVSQDEGIGRFRVGERFRAEDLLYSSLMESSNDGAYALSDVIGADNFVALMNQKTRQLGLSHSYFVNPTGLDPDDLTDSQNYSTAQDLTKLTVYLLNSQPLIWQILATPEFALYSTNGTFHHIIKNTNQLLEEIPGILGGKTGYTDEALGCLVLAARSPDTQGYIINVILGSPAKFQEMRQLLDWLKKAYKW